MANSLLNLPNLKGVRYLGPASAIPLFQMLPQKLDYLELFPSCSHDIWQGLETRERIKVDTLVLVARSFGADEQILSRDCWAESLILDVNGVPVPETEAERKANPPPDAYTPLLGLVSTVSEVRRLILRLHSTPYGNDFFENVTGDVVGEMFLTYSMMDLEEIIFDITMSTVPCEGFNPSYKWIVSYTIIQGYAKGLITMPP